MRLRCSTSALKDAVQTIVENGPRGVDVRAYSVSLRATHDRLHVAASGIRASLRTSIAAEVADDGIVMVSVGALLAVTLKLPSDEIVVVHHPKHAETVRFITPAEVLHLRAFSEDDEISSDPRPARPSAHPPPAEPRPGRLPTPAPPPEEPPAAEPPLAEDPVDRVPPEPPPTVEPEPGP